MDITGKTISSWGKKVQQEGADDTMLVLSFTDGTSINLIPSFGGYTGNSIDEYPTYIRTDS